MASLVVTTSTHCIKVVFNDYSTAFGMTKGVWQKTSIRFELDSSGNYVRVYIGNSPDFCVNHDGSNGSLKIDTIDATTPSSVSDTYDKLIALLG